MFCIMCRKSAYIEREKNETHVKGEAEMSKGKSPLKGHTLVTTAVATVSRFHTACVFDSWTL